MALDIPINVLYLFMATTVSIFLIGMVMFFKKIEGAPFISLIPAIVMFALLVLIDNIEVDYVETISYAVSHPMNVTTSDSSSAFSTTLTAHSEHAANVNSALVGKVINCIEVNMFRTNNPTDNVMIGIGDNDARMVKLFGNITASSINTASRSYQVCLNNHDYWILAYNDYIMVKHTGSSGTDTISVNFNTANPFDDVNSVRAHFTNGVWTDIASQDLRMKLTTEDVNIVGSPVKYPFNQYDIYPFMVFLSVIFVFLAVVFQLRDWS